ncbi:MAG: NAD(P)-dependent oxidoreductase [Alteromonadales bacterium]|nr:NAD(P)-dependent oxidoreductase [Alteromonadales bacterium]
MKVAITGGNGLLGSTLLEYGKKNGVDVEQISRTFVNTHTQLRDLANYLLQVGCDVFIHCAANTNVEYCEEFPAECYRDNLLLTELIINACRISQVKLVFISSTGVYGNYKKSAYCEYDDVRPTTVHHRSKWLAEQSLRSMLGEHLIIRTGWLFGGSWGMTKNFVANRIKEARKSDGVISSDLSQEGCPTYVVDLAIMIFNLINSGWSGTFNCVNRGKATRYEYVAKIIELSKLNVKVKAVNGNAFPRLAKVSNNETAINSKLVELGFDEMPEWDVSLAKYISIMESQVLVDVSRL